MHVFSYDSVSSTFEKCWDAKYVNSLKCKHDNVWLYLLGICQLLLDANDLWSIKQIFFFISYAHLL